MIKMNWIYKPDELVVAPPPDIITNTDNDVDNGTFFVEPNLVETYRMSELSGIQTSNVRPKINVEDLLSSGKS